MHFSKANDRWTTYDPPMVREDGDVPFRYIVESRSDDGEHVVDLTSRGGLGACSCRDFEIRANPNFRRTGEFIPYAPKREGRSDCVHLEAVKAHFYQFVTVPLLARFRNGISKSS